MTLVYLIRHGETEGAEARRYKGRIDVPLSENGSRQVERLADFLSPRYRKRRNKGLTAPGLNAVYCSDLGRAVKSAQIIAEPHGVKPVVAEGIQERNFGVWEGMSFDEIAGKWPDAFNAWAADPLKFSPIEGESTLEARDRAMKAFNEILDRHEGENIAVVTHGGVIRIMLCEMLGMPLENIFRIEQDFAALNVIEIWDYPVIKHINYVV